MKYIKTYENFKPIKINSAKPFKIKKGLLKNAVYLQKGIKSDRKRLLKEKDPAKSRKLNDDKNAKIQKLKDISFKTLKQAEYLRNNTVKENVDNEDKNLISVLESPDFQPEDIQKYIGLDEKEYKLKSSSYYNYDPEYDKDSITIFMKSKKLEDLMDIDNDIIDHLLSFDNHYNNYEYYVEDDELDYLESYLTSELTIKVKELAQLFKFELELESDGNIKKGETRKLFNYLGLKDKLEDFKTEMSWENERAVTKTAKEIIKSLPFDLSHEYSGEFDLELIFEYDTMIEYMKKHNLDVKTISEFLENISEASDFSYEFEYDHYSNLGDFNDLKKEIDNAVDNYISSPDEIFPKLVAIDNLEAFQNNFEHALFDYTYDVSIKYDRKRLDLFRLAKEYNGKILKWFISPEFEKKIKEESSEEEIENYEQFIFKGDATKYNL